MLVIGLISLLIAVPLFSYRITASIFNRIVVLLLIFSSLLAYNTLYYQSLGIGIYSGLFHATNVSTAMEAFLYFVGALILLGWKPATNHLSMKDTSHSSSNEYSLLILFTTIGASLLISSSDIISMYLSIELQSFGVYILATLYRNSESATAAGLKYFLLGGLSSALILLGTAIIYSYTGLTQFQDIFSLLSVPQEITEIATMFEKDLSLNGIVFGLLLMGVGFLFKVAAAPFHNWAPDVYDGVPTIVTSWLTTMPKISIFVFLLELLFGNSEALHFYAMDGISFYNDILQNLLLVTSLTSLVIGTILGLSQYKMKRLLAYSTISHVGFLLLALAIYSEESVESFLFYLIQYSITNVNTFLILLAFSYVLMAKGDIAYIRDLQGEFKKNIVLSLSFAFCLFSIAGIPPLIGFFAKQMVLYSAMHAGYYFLSLVAILVSVISASYYLKVIQVLYFEKAEKKVEMSSISATTNSISNLHSITISTLTVVITLFILQPNLLLNSSHLLALSLFYY